MVRSLVIQVCVCVQIYWIKVEVMVGEVSHKNNTQSPIFNTVVALLFKYIEFLVL